MISSCCLPMILFFFTMNALVVNGEKVWNRDLDNYVCGKWSPLDEPYISNTAPPVAITHIFCGQIKVYLGPNGDQVSSEGFHSRPGNKDPHCATIKNRIEIVFCGDPEQHCPYQAKAKNVMVLNAKQSKWVPRIPDSDLYFMFFPPSWGKRVLVQHITGVFHTCTNGQQNPNCFKYFDAENKLTQICMRNYNYQGCSNHNLAFRILLSWKGDHYRVVTAFPDAGC